MPKLPATISKNLTADDMKTVVNAIRNGASDFYKANTIAVVNSEDLRRLYAQFDAYDSLAQEFMSSLWGRIAKVIITSKLFRNPLGFLKKGIVELGEVIEEAFINPAKPHVYDEDGVDDEATLRREPSEMYTAFYVLNYKIFYKTTIWNNDLSNYFLSWDGVESLIAKMTESLYNGAYQDEFMVMKYMVARALLDGRIYIKDVGDYLTDPTKSVVAIKQLSNDMIFTRTKYNIAGVKTFTPKSDQYFLVTSDYDALESVEVQASAFNLDKVQFMGQRVLVDSFAELDQERLALLFKNNKDYVPLTDAELAQLEDIAGIIIDKDWFQIYDKLLKFTEQYNGQKLFWNYFLHDWKIMCNSPFANAVALVNGKPTINAVTVTPSVASASAGYSMGFKAEVTGTGFYSQTVDWSVIAQGVDASINQNGVLTIGIHAKAGDTITVKATSRQDTTKSGTATVTVQ